MDHKQTSFVFLCDGPRQNRGFNFSYRAYIEMIADAKDTTELQATRNLFDTYLSPIKPKWERIAPGYPDLFRLRSEQEQNKFLKRESIF